MSSFHTRKHLYLDHRSIRGFTFILLHPTTGSMPGCGARDKKIEIFKPLYFKFISLTTTNQKALILGQKVT